MTDKTNEAGNLPPAELNNQPCPKCGKRVGSHTQLDWEVCLGVETPDEDDADQAATDKTCISPWATRPVLYTDTVGGVQTCRDDLWAVTTEELNALHRTTQQAAPEAPTERILQARSTWPPGGWSDVDQAKYDELNLTTGYEVRTVYASPVAAPEAPIDGIRGPLTDAQRQECRHLYNNLRHGFNAADDVIRQVAVYGYVNGRLDFAPEAPASDERAYEAKRLRRVVRALGMESEVPEDDSQLRDVLLAVLGMIAYKLERASPAATTASASGEVVAVVIPEHIRQLLEEARQAILDREVWTGDKWDYNHLSESEKANLSYRIKQVLGVYPDRAPAPSREATPLNLPPLPEMESVVDIDYVKEAPAEWDEDYRSTWAKLQVAARNKMQWRAYALDLRAALAQQGAAQERSSENEALRGEVSMMYQLLDDGEWAEHIATTPHGQCLETAITRLVGKAQAAHPGADEALRLFMGAAYPVAPEINPRGYNWSEAYLDQARAAAMSAATEKEPK